MELVLSRLGERAFKRWLLISLAALVVFTVYDAISDFKSHQGTGHLTLEIGFSALIVSQWIILFRVLGRQHGKIVSLTDAARSLKERLADWEAKTRLIRGDLRESISEQFGQWRLSKAETAVGFLILRGYDFDQIADLLQKSERTVRQQAIAIYNKTGFRNRSEFTGFFLEAIFAPDDED